jgi:hypothetical protein
MEEKQTLRQWLDDLEAQGKEVKLTWEGGNDDGSFNVYINDEVINIDGDSMGGRLVDIVADQIDYGSFAGDFSTSGELLYEDGHMTGNDFYSVSESDTFDIEDKPILIEIPEYLWFDSISITTEGFLSESVSVSVNFNISNGPVVDDHGKLEDELSEMLDHLISSHLDEVKKEVTYVYNEWNFIFDEGEVKDGKRIFIIDSIVYSYENGEDKAIAIEITDEAEEQAEQRKREEEERWKKMQEEWNKNKS